MLDRPVPVCIVSMSRYFFEFSNGHPQPDHEGLDYATTEAAIADGLTTLKQIAADEGDSLSEQAAIRLVIYDALRRPVFAGAISLTTWRFG